MTGYISDTQEGLFLKWFSTIGRSLHDIWRKGVSVSQKYPLSLALPDLF
jgi:hypothetical protein